MALQAHSSPPPSSSRRKYDVFLSFRSGDTRKNFTSHLYNALDGKGVSTFMDNQKLRTGEEIGPALLTAIKQSRISIPIFSKDFASSKWCLKELAEILECYEENHQIVLPIFLDVEPSEVRNQTGSFGEAFQKRKRDFGPEMVNKWRKALTEVGKLKGWDLKEVENGNESKLVKLVVERVLSELNNTPLHVAKYPIGLNSRVEYLLSLLNLESIDPKFVGICGMGGIGKTTIANAVYNRIFKIFEGSSFLADIREQATSKQGLVCLQKQLLVDILGKQDYDISHVNRGSKLIEERLHGKKVFLILDDVDHRMQLNALAAELNWFGPGSRIIITSRDALLLGQVDSIYKPEGLGDNQSLQLFSKHAFGSDQPPEDYMSLSKEVVSYAGGLPLTLEVLGSFLHGVGGKKNWKSTLQKLNEAPPDEIHYKLKISYDGLDYKEREIFLDVACLFIGMHKELAVDMWNACGFHGDIGLKVLIRKSLVRIDDNDELAMHDQLRDMGRRIVYEESPEEPGERSRLWSYEEIMEVLKGEKTNQKVKAILPCSKWVVGDHLRIDDLATMSNLRFLLVQGVNLEGNIEHLPSNLRWLCWQRYPLEILPSNFYLEKLVSLDLSWSNIKQVWDIAFHNKRFENLKVLNLSHCSYLAKSPCFLGFPQLERLILVACEGLVYLHESIGQLKRLVHLDLSECFKLKELPVQIGDLRSLEELNLDDTVIWNLPNSIGMLSAMRCLSLRQCRALIRIPDSIGRIKSLVELYLDNTYIAIPDAIGLLEKLEILCVQDCRYLESLSEIPSSLIFLNASECISLKNLQNPNSIWRIKSLVGLHLDNTSIAKVPDAIGLLEKLEVLCVQGCSKLEFLPELPSSLIFLNASECVSLKRLPDLSNLKKLQTLCVQGCPKLAYLSNLPSSLTFLNASECVSLKSSLSLSKCKKLQTLQLVKCEKLELLKVIGCESLVSLQELTLSLTNLDASWCSSLKKLSYLSNFKKLRSLELGECEELAEIHGLEGAQFLGRLSIKKCRKLAYLSMLPSSLNILEASGCVSLETLPDLSNLKSLRSLWLPECEKLVKINGLEGAQSLTSLDVTGCINLEGTQLKVLEEIRLRDDLPSSFCEIQRWYEISDTLINNGINLCFLIHFPQKLGLDENYKREISVVHVGACIYRRNGKPIRCMGSFQIQPLSLPYGTVQFIRCLQEDNWFGIRLKVIHIIQILGSYEEWRQLKVKCFVSSNDADYGRFHSSMSPSPDYDNGEPRHSFPEESIEDVQWGNKRRRHNEVEGGPSVS